MMFVFLAVIVSAAMNPGRAFCEHQGYTYETSEESIYCVFNDGNKCNIHEFERETCGKEYKKDFPCRKEGEFIFSQFEECCEGLESSSSSWWNQKMSQPSCIEKLNFFQKLWRWIF